MNNVVRNYSLSLVKESPRHQLDVRREVRGSLMSVGTPGTSSMGQMF